MDTDTRERESWALSCIFGSADAAGKKEIMSRMSGPQRLVSIRAEVICGCVEMRIFFEMHHPLYSTSLQSQVRHQFSVICVRVYTQYADVTYVFIIENKHSFSKQNNHGMPIGHPLNVLNTCRCLLVHKGVHGTREPIG